MSAEDLKARICQAALGAWTDGNLDALDKVYAVDYIFHRPPFPDQQGLAAVKEFISGARDAWSDIQLTFHQMTHEGDTTAYRWTWRATHTGESPTLPIPPTGKEVLVVGCTMVRWDKGKIVEEWEYGDYLGVLQQIGVAPSLG